MARITVTRFFPCCYNALTLMFSEKLQQVTKLLDSLERDLKDKSLNSARKSQQRSGYNLCLLVPERTQTLLQLRQHGTSPDNAGPIYSKRVTSSTC